MSTQNPVLDSATLKRKIIRETLAEDIQDYADDDDSPLSDPEAPRGNKEAPFVVTSYPTQQTVHYPHIIVQESNISGSRFDNNQKLWESDIVAMIQIEARTNTERYDLEGGTLAYIVSRDREYTFRDGGFTNVSIQSSGESDVTDISETTGYQYLVQGTVYHD